MKITVSTAVDPICLGEIRFGIFLLPAGKPRARLARWLEDGIERIHCLAWEAATGLRWAQLLAALRASGRSMPIKGSLIAATGGGPLVDKMLTPRPTPGIRQTSGESRFSGLPNRSTRAAKEAAC